jgi:DNA polymerase-3 subunit alpha
MTERDSFVHLHTHSDMSQLDGAGKIVDFVKRAAERQNPALAFTEHGTMRGYYHHHMECNEKGVKPIFGIEFYVAKDMFRKGLTDDEKKDLTKDIKNKQEAKEAIKQYEEREGIRDRWHLTCWAKTPEGLKNLYRLSSLSYIQGFYYKPRIDIDTLIAHKEGLMIATGCLSSPIMDRVISGQVKTALSEADRLREAFGEDLWIEVQPHAIVGLQDKANQFALKLKQRWGAGARLLATQDAHYVEAGDAEHHEVLLCIGTGDVLSNPDRFKFDGDDFFMKSRKEMWEAFKRNHGYMSTAQIKEALNSTLDFADMCTAKVEIDHHKALLPTPPMPAEYAGDDFRYIKDLCIQGWRWREIPARAALYAKHKAITVEASIDIYKQRLMKELGQIKKQKFVGYFLIVRDLYDWARKQNVACGPGRGSAAGSLVSFLLGITAVDPIEHGLIFERFINPSRHDLPDIDMDFEDVRRQEIIEYMRQTYGEDKVCQIATVGKLSGKQCLKDVARVLEVPYAAVNEVTNSIIERSSGDERASMTIEDSFKEFKVCRDFNERYPKVLHHAKKLEGMAKNLGIHAAGVVAAPEPLMELIPLEVRKHEGRDIIVSAIDMYGVGALGLLKLDVLGLRTLTVLNDAVKEIKAAHGVDIDLEKLDLNDPMVLKGFTDHEYVGIFQYDSPGADKICSGVDFVHFEDIAAMTALNRPGTARSGLATQYVDRKKNPKLVEKTSFHPAVSEITKDTLGIIVYQEHVLRIFTDIAGFMPSTADSLRKKIAKKFGDETIGKERENFIEGAVKTTPGMTREVAAKLMDAITFFGSYGFNKSHATAYGVIAYWGMWLKIRYPVEFYWALLKNEPQRLRIQQFAKDAKRHSVVMLPPSVNSSGKHFLIDRTTESPSIRGSLVDIKGVGEKAAQSIMDTQPFADMADFLGRIDRRAVHKGVVLALAKAGALNELLPNVRWFVENIETFWKAISRGKSGPAEGTRLLEASASEPMWDPEEAQLIASQVNPLAFGKHPMDAYADFVEKHIKLPIVSMSEEDFFKKYNNKTVLVGGVIVEVKLNQIGDFHTGALPSAEERERMFWGQRYANVNVEDAGGVQNRIKFDIDIYEDMRSVIECGIGAPVFVLASVNGKYENLRAHFAVDLEGLRKRVRAGEPLGLWERIITGNHPVKALPLPEGKTEAELKDMRVKRWRNRAYRTSPRGGTFYGACTNVRLRYDKKGSLMAFFGLIGGDGYFIDAICFGSSWPDVSPVIKPGAILKIQIDKQADRLRESGVSHVFNGGLVKRYKEK